MEVTNKVLYLTGKIGTTQNAGKMERKVHCFNSTATYPGHPYFRWCYTDATAQAAEAEIALKDGMLCDHALKATTCQKKLISCMGSVRSCIIT